MLKVISIDHGNRLIKTPHFVFPSSYNDSEHLPVIGGDVLKYEDKKYTLVDRCLPVLNDKTEDERYFILTLFAIGKELQTEAEVYRRFDNQDGIQVELLIGLPLQHYEAYRKKFEQYFYQNRSRALNYDLNGIPYNIRIIGAHAFPQAYAAAVTAYDELKDSKIINIIDIGGFTVDCLQLNQFKPNMNLCTSIYRGVNELLRAINDNVRSMGGKEIADNIIEDILKRDPAALDEYSEKRISLVTTAAYNHASRLLAEVAQNGFDLDEDKTVFMGGGAILMKEYLLAANKVKKPIFIDDVHANAKGYELIYNMKQSAGRKNLAI